MADGESKLKILGEVDMPVRVHGTNFKQTMTVVDMESMDGIWGMDFLNKFGCDLKMSTQTFRFNRNEYPLNTDRHCILPHSVKLARDVILPSGVEMALSAHLNSPFRSRQEVTLEPSVYFVQKHGIIPAKSVTIQSKRQRCTPIQLFNASDEDIKLPKGTIIGYAFPAHTIDMEQHGTLNSTCTTDNVETSGSVSDVSLLEKLEDAIPTHLEGLYDKSSNGLAVDQKIKLSSLLIKFQSTFFNICNRHWEYGIS
jgi:hypothetical protein